MISINMLVAMISSTCMNASYTTGFRNWVSKNESVLGSDRNESYAIDCFDHYNNCMVGTNGVIKSSVDFKVCKKQWETK